MTISIWMIFWWSRMIVIYFTVSISVHPQINEITNPLLCRSPIKKEPKWTPSAKALAQSSSIQYTALVLANTTSAHLASLFSIRETKSLFLSLATEAFLVNESTEDNLLLDPNEVSRPSIPMIEPIDLHSSKPSALVSTEDATVLRGSLKFIKLAVDSSRGDVLVWTVSFSSPILGSDDDRPSSEVDLGELSDSQDGHSSDQSESSDERSDDDQPAFLYEMVEFIRSANLNKTTTSSLLSLLRSVGCDQDLPRTVDQLWSRLRISFNHDTFIHCSVCFTQLNAFHDRCSSCSNADWIPNSELIVQSTTDELRRVIESNIKLIEWYSQPQNRIVSDVVSGTSGW